MAITQMYDKGQKFETYTKDQLISSVWGSLSTDFIWEGRTLSCYRIPGEDGKLSSGYDVPIGAEMSSNLEEQNIYGIWTMDKSPDPVKVYFIGDSGEVSVDIVEHIVSPPLAKGFSGLKEITHTVSNVDSNYHEIIVYRQPEYTYGNSDGCNKILFKIRKSAATTVLSVCHQNQLMNLNDSDDFNNYLMSEGGNSWTVETENIIGKNWDYSALTKQYGLSVFFSEQGRLTYYPNKDYVNP